MSPVGSSVTTFLLKGAHGGCHLQSVRAHSQLVKAFDDSFCEWRYSTDLGDGKRR